MFWGCFGFSGIGTLVPIEGMMNSARYTELIQRTIVRDMQRAFPEAGGIFQQDLASCHTSKQVKGVFRQADIKVLDWPGNSPDLNSIENLWSILKSRLKKLDCTTKIKLIEAIIQVWYRDPQIQENCQTLVQSMRKRVKEVLKSKGGLTNY